MKTLIIYMSTHGCTKQVVTELAEQLNGEVTIKNLKEDKNPDFQNYDRVIIGGSIHAGQIQRKIREYCEAHLENFEKMRFFEKLIVRKIAKVEQSVSKIDHEAIKNFAKKMDKTFSPFVTLI